MCTLALTVGAPGDVEHAVSEQVVHHHQGALERREPDGQRAVPRAHRRAATLLAFLHEDVVVESLREYINLLLGRYKVII